MIRQMRYSLSVTSGDSKNPDDEKTLHQWTAEQPFGTFAVGETLTVPGLEAPQTIKHVDHIFEESAASPFVFTHTITLHI